MNIFLGIFFVLHGLVHLLYAGQSLRFFELIPNMTWPDGAWFFSKLFGVPATRMLSAVFLALATISYLAGGLGYFCNRTGGARQQWARQCCPALYSWCFGMASCRSWLIKAGLVF